MSHSLASALLTDPRCAKALGVKAARLEECGGATLLAEKKVQDGQGSASNSASPFALFQHFGVVACCSAFSYTSHICEFRVPCASSYARRMLPGSGSQHTGNWSQGAVTSAVPRSWPRGPGTYLFPADPSIWEHPTSPVNHQPSAVLSRTAVQSSPVSYSWRQRPVYELSTGHPCARSLKAADLRTGSPVDHAESACYLGRRGVQAGNGRAASHRASLSFAWAWTTSWSALPLT